MVIKPVEETGNRLINALIKQNAVEGKLMFAITTGMDFF